MKQIQPETLRSLQKGLLSLAVVVGTTVSVPLQRAQAETQEQCQRRIAHAEHELHEAIERHGRHAGKLVMSGANCGGHENEVGVSIVSGGTNTSTGGARNVTGTITTMTEISHTLLQQ